MNVLSLFDGISCGRVALERAGIKVDNYYASEIEAPSIAISKYNHPDIIQVGDITKLSYKDGVLYSEFGEFYVGSIDLVIGGSPCQSISGLGKKDGLAGKSGLFYHWLRIKEEVSPKFWLLENVVGNKNATEVITKLVSGNTFILNSNCFSAQNRARRYWTNIKVDTNISESKIQLQDILEEGVPETSVLTPGRLRWINSDAGKLCIGKRYAAIDPQKANCLTARSDASWNCNYVTREGVLTKLSCVEYERLQTLPDNYTACVSSSNRYKALGNGWTVDVIAHILKGINKEII